MQVAVDNVSKFYAETAVVSDVRFELEEGSLLTLLGPSGSGKTTTLMMVAGFVTPDAGRIEVAGKDITHMQPNRRNLGVVFQSYALIPHKTVYQNVAFPLEIRKTPRVDIKKRVEEMLRRVGLVDFRDKDITQISGGQKQRVALARALVFEPPVLLLDEPLGALDKQLREQLQHEIKDLQSSLGVTAIHVTHDQEEALSMSDRIGVMDQGRLLQIGTPKELYDEPATRFVAEFLGGVNLFQVYESRRNGTDYEATLTGGIRVPCHPCADSVVSGMWLGVRPERVRLVEEKKDNLFMAEIIKRTFLGSTMEYALTGPDGITLQARAAVNEDRPAWDVGMRVGVYWTARSAWIFE